MSAFAHDLTRPHRKRVLCYDTETTGLKPAFNVPLQFGCIGFDPELREQFRLDVRGRSPSYILPAPAAMVVTGQRISDINAQRFSNYQLMSIIKRTVEENSPAILVTFNGIRYDDEVLRHAFFGNLMPPYITQWNGNERMDVLSALKASAVCAPDAVDLPLNDKGKRSFKLEHVAPANGYEAHDAHDAMGDVEATMFVGDVIRSRTPSVWVGCAAIRTKAGATELLAADQPFLQLDWQHQSDKPVVRVLLPVAVDHTNPNEWLCVNLASDIKRLVLADANALKSAFRSVGGVKAVVPIKSNAMPLIFPLDHPAVLNLDRNFDPVNVQIIRDAVGFADRLKDASDLRKSEYDEPTHFRQQLYSGGFFPTREDETLFEAFHAARPEDKFDIVRQFADARARQIGWWLMGAEWPDAMPAGERTAFVDAQREHLMADAADWTTIPSALREIAEMRPTAIGDALLILDEYEAYLRSAVSHGLPFAAE